MIAFHCFFWVGLSGNKRSAAHPQVSCRNHIGPSSQAHHAQLMAILVRNKSGTPDDSPWLPIWIPNVFRQTMTNPYSASNGQASMEGDKPGASSFPDRGWWIHLMDELFSGWPKHQVPFPTLNYLLKQTTCDYLDHILSISSSWSQLRAEIFDAGELASIFWCPQRTYPYEIYESIEVFG